MKKTIVTQENIHSLQSAHSHFEKVYEDGSVPIVLIPNDYGRWFRIGVSIPSGVYCLEQRWHKYSGMAKPGFIGFWPGWNRISHVVTKSTTTYNAPIRKVPTSDNIMVNIDLSLIFQIGPDEDGAYKFIYTLGANRLDDLLTSLTDESIRGLVYDVPYKKIHDLRESFAQNTMRSLNKVLSHFGVIIKSVKVTDVQLPEELSKTLENTTSFKTKMLEQEKKHENNLRILLNNEKQNLTAIIKSNERQIQNLNASKDRALIQRGEEQAKCDSKISVALLEAESRAATRIAQAESNKAVAEKEGKKLADELIQRTKMECDAKLVVLKQQIESMIKLSEAELEAAKSKAAIIREEADVEELHAKNLANLRGHNYEMERIKILGKIASEGKMVISGDTGESLFQQICPGSKSDMLIHPLPTQ